MNPFEGQDIPEVSIHVVGFSNDAIEIEFSEARDQSKHVAETRRRFIDRARFAEQIAHIEVLIQELLDDADIVRRDPPKRIQR